jgi:hypothetical protein
MPLGRENTGKTARPLRVTGCPVLSFGNPWRRRWGYLATVLDFFNIAKPMADQFL